MVSTSLLFNFFIPGLEVPSGLFLGTSYFIYVYYKLKSNLIQALDLVGELALAMGPQTRTQIPQLVPAVLAALADSKNTVRAAAIATLNIFIKETSLKAGFSSSCILYTHFHFLLIHPQIFRKSFLAPFQYIIYITIFSFSFV